MEFEGRSIVASYEADSGAIVVYWMDKHGVTHPNSRVIKEDVLGEAHSLLLELLEAARDRGDLV